MYTEREIKDKFEKVSGVYPIVAVVGARQAGKTTFLKEQIKEKKSSYLLFDDPDVRQLFEEDIKKFENQYISEKEVSVLDEVQYCKDPGRKLKYLADSGRKLWITSSSEIILSKKVLSYLVGRVSIIKLYAFSLKEFLKLKKQKEFTKEILERIIWEHATYGGYPKVGLVDDVELKKIILKDLYDTMVLKDIARTFSIDDIDSLERFVKHLSLNIGGIASYDRLANDLNLSFQTIKKYADAMEKSYLIARIYPFFNNKTKEIIKQPKIYFLDTGVRNVISKEFPNELEGKLFENYVLSELIKAGFSVKYWRTKTGSEVDFIIEKDSEVIPVEVKLSSDANSLGGLNSFIKIYKPKKAFVVFYKGKTSKSRIDGCEIFYVNIFDLISSHLK